MFCWVYATALSDAAPCGFCARFKHIQVSFPHFAVLGGQFDISSFPFFPVDPCSFFRDITKSLAAGEQALVGKTRL
jgi:hypothetical protein